MINIFLELKKENEKEILKLLYLKNGEEILLEKFGSLSFNNKELEDILKLKTSFVNEEINLSIISSDERLDSIVYPENIKKIEKNKELSIRGKKRGDNELINLNFEEFYDHKNEVIDKDRIELNIFLIKKYKKMFISVLEYKNNKLIDSDIYNLEKNILSDENIKSLLKEKDLSNRLKNTSVYLNNSSKKGISQTKILIELLEKNLLKRIDYRRVPEIDNKGLIRSLERHKLNKERISYLKELENPKNVIVYTDGSGRFNNESASFIVKYMNNEINKTYLFGESFVEYEEIALLKSLEYLIDNNLMNKKIFIISDKDSNIDLINMLKLNTDNKLDKTKNYKNLFYKVKNKINRSKSLEINFSAIKSHSNEEKDIDFIYNAKVDQIAAETIYLRNFIGEDFVMNKNLLIANELKNIDLRVPRLLYKKDKEEKENDPTLGFLASKISKKVGNRKKNFKNTTTFFLISRIQNEQEHLRIGVKRKESQVIFSDTIITNDRQKITKDLNDFINKNISKNHTDAIRFFYSDEKYKGIVRNEISSRIKKEDNVFKLLANKKEIFEGCYLLEDSHSKIVGDYGFVSEFNKYLKENYSNKKKSNLKKEDYNDFQEKTIDINFKSDLFGNKDIFPAFDYLEKYDVYYFFEKTRTDNLKIIEFHKNKNREVITNEKNLIKDFNDLLKSKAFNIARNCIISVDSIETKNELIETFNKTKNLDCNVVKIIPKRFNKNHILIVEKNDYKNQIEGLKWFKELNHKKPNNVLKKQ